jgi:hypothetical protein
MDTGTRRFILRLAVGLLTFLIGVAAAWALGAFNPFQNSYSGTRYYHHRHYRDWNSPPSFERFEAETESGAIYLLKGRNGIRIEREFRKSGRDFSEFPPPPPAPPSAPAPPMAR